MAKRTVRPRAASCADRRPEVAAALDVHAGGRLVEDQQLGVGQQRHARTAAAAAGRPSTCRPGGRRCRRCRPARAPRRPGRCRGTGSRSARTVSRDGEVLEQPAGLHDGRDQAARDGAGRRQAVDLDGAARRAGTGRASCRWWWSCRRRSGPRKATTSPGRDGQVDPPDGRPPRRSSWCTPRSETAGMLCSPGRPGALGGCAGDCHGPIVPRRTAPPPPICVTARP